MSPFTEDEKNEIIGFIVEHRVKWGYIGCPFDVWKVNCSPKNSPCAKLFPYVHLYDCPCNQFPTAEKENTIDKFWKAME